MSSSTHTAALARHFCSPLLLLLLLLLLLQVVREPVLLLD
jgi:hypothetical protein